MEQDIGCLTQTESDRAQTKADHAQTKDGLTQGSPGTLADLLRDRGLTYEAAAVLAQVDTATISRIVRGHSRARPRTIVKLARALGISPKRLEAMSHAAWKAAHSGEVSA